jgi:hypothetical protein
MLLKIGDHIARDIDQFHKHHGIIAKLIPIRIIHFVGQEGRKPWKNPEQVIFRETSLSEFTKGHRRLYVYKRNCSTENTLRNAQEMIGTRDYSVIKYNCEDIINQCKFGRTLAKNVPTQITGLIIVYLIVMIISTKITIADLVKHFTFFEELYKKCLNFEHPDKTIYLC